MNWQNEYNRIADDAELLVKANKWRELRAYFYYFDTKEEQIAKIIAWCRFFLAHFFQEKTPDFHYELVEALLSEKNEYIAAPRGYSKTTIAQGVIACISANAWRNFIVIIEKSLTEASEVLSMVRGEFADNPMIRQVYGDLIGQEKSGVFSEYSKDTQSDILINGVRIRAKGFNTPIRGLKSKQYRPDLVILDDVESDEHIRSEEQRRKYMENFTQGIIPALDIGGSVKVIGTILHKDSMLSNLISQHDGKLYRAYDPTNPKETLLWPNRWTYERLIAKKADMEMEGLAESKFSQEYLNEPVDDDMRSFKSEWFDKTFTEEDIKFKTLNRYITIDTANSKGHGSDYTGVVIVDWDSDNNWFIQYAKRYKVNSAELVDLIFELWQRFKPVKIGVEKNSFQDQIEPYLKIKREELGVYPLVEELEHRGMRKEDRIRGALQGRFEAGKIFFKQNAMDDSKILKGELYDFPLGKHDDLVDSLSYIEQLGNRPYSKQKSQMSSIEHRFYEYKRKKGVGESLANKF